MVSRGFWTDGSFDPGGVLDVLGRPRVHRVLWFTLWSAALGTLFSLALGLPAAHVLYRRRVPGGALLRAALLAPFVLPTVVVGVAFRQLLTDSGPLGFLGLDGTPVAIIAGLVFFNASVVIRVVGGAWESLDPRPAEAAAALGATPAQVLRTVTLPALRPAVGQRGQRGVPLLRHGVRRGAHPGRAAVQLGRDRDLPAHHQPPRPPGRGRAVGPPAGRGGRAAARRRTRASYGGPDGRAGRPATAAPHPRRRTRPARDRRSSRCWWSARSRRWSPGRCAATAPGAWPTTAPCRRPASSRRCWSR